MSDKIQKLDITTGKSVRQVFDEFLDGDAEETIDQVLVIGKRKDGVLIYNANKLNYAHCNYLLDQCKQAFLNGEWHD